MNVSWVLAPNGTKNWKTRKTLGNEVLWEQINISWWGRGVSGGRCPWAALVLLSPKPMMITCLKGAEPKASGTGGYFPQDPPRKPTYAATHWTMTSGYSESPFNSKDMLPGIRGVSLTGPIWSLWEAGKYSPSSRSLGKTEVPLSRQIPSCWPTAVPFSAFAQGFWSPLFNFHYSVLYKNGLSVTNPAKGK